MARVAGAGSGLVNRTTIETDAQVDTPAEYRVMSLQWLSTVVDAIGAAVDSLGWYA
jgi:hypothetical protein